MTPRGRCVLVGVSLLASLLSPGLSAQDPATPQAPSLTAPAAIPQDGVPDILTGMATSGGVARLLSGADHTSLIAGAPFGGFTGGVRVAMGDVTGDGAADLIVAQGAGGGFVKVFNGASGLEIASGYPFGPAFTGGVFVAAGDLDADGLSDVVLGAGMGGFVRSYSLAGGVTLLNEGFPYGPAFSGGVRVAVGVDQDGTAAIATAPASGPGQVQVFRIDPIDASPSLFASLLPYGPAFTGGVFVAMGDVNGDGLADLVTSSSGGARPIQVFSGAPDHALLRSIGPGSPQGISVAASDLSGDGRAEIIGGVGPGGPPLVGIFDGATGVLLSFFAAEAPAFAGGVLVAAPSAAGGIRFTSAATTTFTTGTAGSFTITTSAVPTVTGITVTGPLPDGVTFTDHHDGTATLSGTPVAGVGGVHALTFTATNGDDAPATQTFALRVEGPPQITSANATTFHVNGAGSFTVTTIGFPRPTLMSTGTLPPGVTFTSNGDGTATLAGTPQAGSGGTYPLTITASNGVGSAATQAFTLTVDASPVFTSAASTTFLAGVASSFAITASAEPAITTITQSGPLPTGVSFLDNGGGSATLSGTPALGTGGSYPFTLTAANGVGPNAVQSFTLTVQQAPAITSANATTFAINAASSFDITSTGFPTASLTASGPLPAGVTFADDGDGTARLTGTPTIGGVFTLTITANNGVGTAATQTFTLTVEEGAAITSAAATTFVVGTAGSFPVTSTGTPTPTVTYAGTVPGGVTVGASVNGTALLSGTPAADMGGTYPIDFTATNGVGAPAVQNFVLTVHQAPAFTSAATATFTLGIAGTFDVQSTGFPIATLTVDGDLPDGVTFVDDTDGSGRFVGTPDPGTSGNYPVTITATNGVGATPATQSFTLSVHQIPAITSAASTSFSVGQAGTFDIVATGFPTPTIAMGGTPPPSGVSFTPNGDGTATLAGTPAAGTGGTHTLTFTATNAAGSSVPQTFTLNVNTPPSFTSGTSTTFTAGTAGSFTVTADGLPAPTISHTGGAFPAGVTFNPSTNTIEGTATAIGTFAGLAFTATNGVNPDATQSFTLTVVCPVITVTATPPALPNGIFGVAYPNVQFGQTGGGAGTWSATGLPPGVGLDSGTGLLSGTPTNTGTFSAIVTFTNTAGCTGTFSDMFDVAPNAVADSYSPNLGNTQVVVANDSSPTTPFFAYSSSVLLNDAGPGLAVTPFSGATALGGNVSLNASGGFTYTPGVGDTGNDSFSYTVTSNGVSATATVTLGLGTQRVWYVQQGAGGDGRSQSPLGVFTSLNDPGGDADLDGPNDFVYVYAGTYATGFETESGQTLWGAGTAFAPNPDLTIAATSRPTLQGTVTIAGNAVTISSLAISSATSTGITNTGIVNALTVKNDVTLTTTTGTAISFSNVNSTDGGTGFGITFRSVTTNGAATGISLHDVNASTGSFAITGVDGGDPDPDPDADSGGIITNATTRGAELVNVGRSVRLGGMRFVNAGSTDGAASTECDGYLTGNNTLCHAAIHLVNVGAGIGGQVALNTVVVDGGAQVGINARGVTNLTMHAVEVMNVGTDSHESGVMLQNVFGTGAVTGSSFHNNTSRQFHLANATGTLSSFTITGSTFANSDGPNGVQGILIEGGGASTTMVVTAGGPGAGEGNTFNNLFSNAWQIAAQNDATLTMTLQNSSVTNTNGIVAQASLGSLLTTVIQNNTFIAGPKTGAGAISIKTDGGGSLVGDIRGNTIGQPGVAGSGTACESCTGMFINARDPGSMDITVVGNTIQNVNGSAIVLTGGQAATQNVDAVITGNLIREPGPKATTDFVGLDLRNGVSSGPPADAGCLAVTLGGTVTPPSWPSLTANAKNRIFGTWNSAFGEADVFLWRRFSTVVNLPGLSGAVAAWITARNDFDGTPAITVLNDAPSPPFGSAASCAP